MGKSKKISPRQRYGYYLQSDHWQALREKALVRDNYKCQNCGSQDELQVHHLAYGKGGDDVLEDLTTLCSDCHSELHEQ